jgi:hypothetical protein
MMPVPASRTSSTPWGCTVPGKRIGSFSQSVVSIFVIVLIVI